MNFIRTYLRNFHYDRRMRPEQDWFALLIAALFLIVLSTAWNLWLFDQVKSGTVIGSATAPAPVITAAERSFQDVQASFAARATEEAKYETGGYTFIDPAQ